MLVTINNCRLDVDVTMLREQRDYLLSLPQDGHFQRKPPVEGLINLLDAMLDAAELGKVL